MIPGVGISPFFSNFYSSTIIPPSPPYIIATTNTDILNSISGLTYQEGDGPSQESISFKIAASGLVPPVGNITVTPSSDIEVFNGTIWVNTPFNIPYAGGFITTPLLYKVRLKAGLSPGNISGTLTLSGANAPDFPINISGTVIADPVIEVDPTSLNFENIVVGEESEEQYFAVTGTGLVGNLTVTPPSDFLISQTSGSGFSASPIILVPSSGNVSATIYVIFAPTLEQDYSSNIVCSSATATSQNVAVVGSGIVPLITLAGGPLTFSDTIINQTSSQQSYTVSGTDLVDDITITPTSIFKISLTNGSGYSSSPIVLSPTGGTVASTTIYVVFSPTAVQSYNTNITHTSNFATTKNLAVSGSGVAIPVITVSKSSIGFSDTGITRNSTQDSYTVSGVDLIANIVVTPPSGFEISLISGSGFSSSAINLVPSGGTVSSTTIYVRFSPTLVQAYSGNLSHTSTSATTKNVSLSGNGISLFMSYTTTGSEVTLGDYKIITFLSSDVNGLVITAPGYYNSVEHLIVGGGGGGGAQGGGAGGGGQVLSGSTSLSVQTYPIVIGAGGAGAINAGNGSNGANSSFNAVVALGGGYGGGGAALSNGGNGGNGGGGNYLGVGGTGDHTGGSGDGSVGSGGGGAGGNANGTNGTSTTGGTGGDGIFNNITGASIKYAGGGGGRGVVSGGTGANGGGGTGGSGAANGVSGTANLGGGGGGAGVNFTGGSGGSGIIKLKVRFQITYFYAFYGDSFTGGSYGGINDTNRYARLVADDAGYSLTNGATSGQSLTQNCSAGSNFNKTVIPTKTDEYKKLFLCWSMLNEIGVTVTSGKPGTPFTNTASNMADDLTTIINYANATKGWAFADIIWAADYYGGAGASGPNHPDRTTELYPFADAAMNAASALGCQVISHRAYMLANGGDSLLTNAATDDHPTLGAQTVMAQNIINNI